MTGFGESIQTQAGITCRIELRTVNNRHFKFSLKARDGFGRFESRIETTLRESIRRGTVQMSLDLNGSGELLGRRIDTDRLSAHLKQIQEFSKSHGLSAPDRVEDCWHFLELCKTRSHRTTWSNRPGNWCVVR